MFILFGLGNNEQKYLQTKHNAGRIIVENLSKIWNLEFKKQKNFHWTKYQNFSKSSQNQQNKQNLQLKNAPENIYSINPKNLNLENIQDLGTFNRQQKLENYQNSIPKNYSNFKSQDLQISKNILDEFYLGYSDSFMNNSGEVLQSFCNYYKLNQKNCQIIILQDDSDQLIGNFKLSIGGGTAGHNGIISIYKHFDKEKIWRLKIGIRPIDNKLKSETFVLSGIEGLERENLGKISSKISENLVFFSDFTRLQNLINSL